MSRFKKFLFGTIFLIVFFAIAGFFFIRHLITKSFPTTEGVITFSNLSSSIEVYRDEFGVPHIIAQDEDDLMFAVGYVHAQDRLWQMELFRRVGEGRLSELFDTVTIRFDKLFRTIGLHHLADSVEKNLHPTSRRILQAYANGVNAFIQSNKGAYPIEFDMLYHTPERWEPKHSVLISKLLAWELSFAWWVELTLSEIREKVSPEKFTEIIPIEMKRFISNTPKFSLSSLQEKWASFKNVVHDYRSFFRLGPYSAGSNAWAVNGTRSMSGKPLLANDPHLMIIIPSKWYEIHLSAPGWNVAGVSVPGLPLVVIGNNDSLAWGFTNLMLDDADFYIEMLDSLDSKKYRFKNLSIPIITREETIYVGSKDSIIYNVQATHHGPIIDNVHPTKEFQSNFKNDIYRISLKWTGFSQSDEILGFYRINRATNHIQFLEGLRLLNAPAQHAVYADVHNNIGLFIGGKIPIRAKNHNPMLASAGWTGDFEWQGFLPFEKLPIILNPPSGIIVSANQNITDELSTHYFSYFWEPPSRSDRIKDLLTATEKFTAEDFKQIQQDVTSYYCRDISMYILDAFSNSSTENTEVTKALEYIHNWDFRGTSEDIATTIFHAFFLKLLQNIFEDELGTKLYHDFLYFPPIIYRIIAQLLTKEHAEWFDNVHTEYIETRDEIVRKSLDDAISDLKQKLGNDMKRWRWGNVHKATFEHPFGRRKPLDMVFNIGPFSLGGSGTTINKAEFRFTQPFNLFAGVSMRQIVDLDKPDEAYRVITPGQSGQPFHQHYDDQVPLWLTGSYRKVTINLQEIRNSNWKQLLLKPKD